VLLQRERSGGLGNDLTSASLASIDAGMVGRFSGHVFLVERRADADLYVVAALEECHGSPSFAELDPGNSAVSCRMMWDSPRMIRKI
jgi:hypothetical protein